MSTVQGGPAFGVGPLEAPSAPEINRAPSSERTWGGLPDRLHERPWPLPVLDFVALAAAYACALAWSRDDGAWLITAALPLLGVLVLCLRGVCAPQRTLLEVMRFANPDFGSRTSGRARDSRGRAAR